MKRLVGMLAGASLLVLAGAANADTITGNWTASITGTGLPGAVGPDATLNATSGSFSTLTSGPTIFTDSSFIQVNPNSSCPSGTTACKAVTGTVSVTISGIKDNGVSVAGSITELGAWTANFSTQTDAVVWAGAQTVTGFPLMQDLLEPEVFTAVFADGTKNLDIFFVDGADWDVQTKIGAELTATPLPAAIWMFGSGLGLLGLMKRRRQKPAASVFA